MMMVIFLKTFMTQIHNKFFIIFKTFEILTQLNRNVAYGYMKKIYKEDNK